MILCTCETKTPEIRHHAENCAYRIYIELLAERDALADKLNVAGLKAEKLKKKFIDFKKTHDMEREFYGRVAGLCDEMAKLHKTDMRLRGPMYEHHVGDVLVRYAELLTTDITEEDHG